MQSDSCERIPGKETNTSVAGMVMYSLLQCPFVLFVVVVVVFTFL